MLVDRESLPLLVLDLDRSPGVARVSFDVLAERNPSDLVAGRERGDGAARSISRTRRQISM